MMSGLCAVLCLEKWVLSAGRTIEPHPLQTKALLSSKMKSASLSPEVGMLLLQGLRGI